MDKEAALVLRDQREEQAGFSFDEALTRFGKHLSERLQSIDPRNDYTVKFKSHRRYIRVYWLHQSLTTTVQHLYCYIDPETGDFRQRRSNGGTTGGRNFKPSPQSYGHVFDLSGTIFDLLDVFRPLQKAMMNAARRPILLAGPHLSTFFCQTCGANYSAGTTHTCDVKPQ